MAYHCLMENGVSPLILDKKKGVLNALFYATKVFARSAADAASGA